MFMRGLSLRVYHFEFIICETSPDCGPYYVCLSSRGRLESMSKVPANRLIEPRSFAYPRSQPGNMVLRNTLLKRERV